MSKSKFHVKSRRLVGAICALALVGTAACGGDDEGSDAPTTTSAADDSEASATTEVADEADAPTATEAAAASNLPDVVEIGFLNEMSGAAAFCGIQQLDGANLAIEEARELNFFGDDVEVELIVADTKQTAEGAVGGHRSLVDEGVPVIAGPCVGGMGDATLPLSEAAGIPQILTTASGSDISGEYAFRGGIKQPRYAANSVAMVAARGAEKVSVIWDQEQPSIVEVWNDVQRPQLEADGVELLAVEAVTAQVTEFSGQISSLLAGDPDAVGVLLLGQPNLTVVKQLREAGFDGQIWGQQGMLNDFFITAGADVEGTLVAVGFAANFTEPSSVNFTERYVAKFDSTPSELAAHGYDTVWLAMRAIKAAGSVDREEVRAALDSITEMEGAQGTITFDETGDPIGSGGVVEMRDGTTVGVEE